jgi:translation elongation factor EF-G
VPEDNASIRVTIPQEMEGEVMQALNRAGGLITNITQEGEHSTAVDASLPSKALSGFQTWLENYTKGQGRISQGPTDDR